MAEPNFAVTRMRIAIDTSGSTAGGTLDAEIRAVKEISTTIKSQKEPLLVMPWNSRASAPISPKECKNLGSTGGTNTSSLYGNPDCLKALQNCGLWFLFTDGQISKAEVENFALNTVTYGLHGTPNVVTIFGRAADTLPGLVDFSVGIITYSAAPDSLLLFHDVSTGTVFLLQAKGCFKALLPAGSTQPELTSTLAWHQLPSISYKDLASLRTPKPKKLAADELALADGLVIRLKDLYSGTASAEVLERVSEPENLRSLTIHQSSAGRADEFQNFLEQQQQQVPHAPRERVDIDGKAQEAIITLLNAVKNRASDKILEVYREKLRVAHGENWKIFRSLEEQDREVVRESSMRFQAAMEISLDISSELGEGLTPSRSMGYERSSSRSTMFGIAHEAALVEESWLPGFVRLRNQKNPEFVGPCMICGENTLLALLIQRPSTGGVGPTILLRESFSPSVCCAECASYLVPPANLLDQPIVGALALVSVTKNKEAWVKALSTLCGGGAGGEWLLPCFAASFEVEANQKAILDLEEHSLLRQALEWIKEDLKKLTAASN